GEVFLEIPGQLKENRPTVSCELRHAAKKGGYFASRTLQAPEGCDRCRRLECKPKARGHLARPRLEERPIGHPAKRTVDLDGCESLCVIFEHLVLRERLRVELPPPFRIAETARANEKTHCLSVPPCAPRQLSIRSNRCHRDYRIRRLNSF